MIEKIRSLVIFFLKRQTFIVFFLLFSIICPKNLFAIMEGDGFLGIDVILDWHGGFSTIDDNSVPNNVVGIQLALVGAANYYGVTTHLQIVSNMINASEQYSGESNYIAQGEIDYFSYISLNIQYSLWRNQYFNVLAGYGLGHLGYLSKDFEINIFTIFLSPVASFYWFISKHFATLMEAEVPIGTYRRNAARLWHVQLKHEIIFEPKGNIMNPIPNSVFLAIGWRLDYINIITKASTPQETEAFLLRPYFRFTYLY